MTPSEYLDSYHNLTYTLDGDSTGVARLSRYQSGASGIPWAARVPLMSGIAAELNRTRTPGAHAMNWAHLPSEFVIDDYPLTKIAVVRVFMGKASPDEIKDVIWLAHRNGIITNAAAPTPRPG